MSELQGDSSSEQYGNQKSFLFMPEPGLSQIHDRWSRSDPPSNSFPYLEKSELMNLPIWRVQSVPLGLPLSSIFRENQEEGPGWYILEDRHSLDQQVHCPFWTVPRVQNLTSYMTSVSPFGGTFVAGLGKSMHGKRCRGKGLSN